MLSVRNSRLILAAMQHARLRSGGLQPGILRPPSLTTSVVHARCTSSNQSAEFDCRGPSGAIVALDGQLTIAGCRAEARRYEGELQLRPQHFCKQGFTEDSHLGGGRSAKIGAFSSQASLELRPGACNRLPGEITDRSEHSYWSYRIAALALWAMVCATVGSSCALAQDAAAEACPQRPAAGSVVGEPEDLRSQNGVLRVDFTYRNSVDANGQNALLLLIRKPHRGAYSAAEAGRSAHPHFEK